MNAFNNVQKFDRSNMLRLLTSFPKQFQEARQIGENFDLTIRGDNITNILFAGMGGSAIGGDLIISCLYPELNIPATVIRNYLLPKFVNESSLVIISSYSGDTEETLSCYEDAKRKQAQIIGITSGGKLVEKANQDGTPIIRIPGGAPPRTALGYLTLPLLILFERSGITKIGAHDYDETWRILEQQAIQYSPQCENNFAFHLAQTLNDKIPILYCSIDFLDVVARRWKGQFSENAKVLAFANAFPEINHNEIVGWERLPHLLTHFQIIYLRDHEDFERNQRRMNISRTIFETIASPIVEVFTQGNSRLARLFSLIYLGDWTSFYLAINNGIDPTPINKIQILKHELGINCD